MATTVAALAATARRMWVRFETYHSVTYFTPESRQALAALGCDGGWMGYFATRAAPLGAVPEPIVTAAFYNFHPIRVGKSIPAVWELAEPKAFLAARLAGADSALRRLLGEDVVAGADVAEAAGLAVRAAAAAPTAGRILGTANSILPTPDAPHLALWQAATTLRESRGDGHVAALVAADLDPCETLVLFGADRGLDPTYLKAARRWSDQEWQEATDRLADRDLVTTAGVITDAGTELRRWIEDRTDESAIAPWRALGAEATERLADVWGSLALTIATRNDAMRSNPMALDAVRELS
jgi:helix-turn-helix protein